MLYRDVLFAQVLVEVTIMKNLKEKLDPVTYHDIVRQIFLNLDLASLKSARQVCKEWDGLVMGESGEVAREGGRWRGSWPASGDMDSR